MSYDLYFYKQKIAVADQAIISSYLNENLTPVDENQIQWFFENTDTEVYFSLDFINETEDIDDGLSFENFENTGFSFNLNFMRPSFFGLEAFQFLDRFIADLNLFVINPQSESELPYKPEAGVLFEDWNRSNLQYSGHYLTETDSSFFPMEKSNEIWRYNFNRKRIQDKLGKAYFVPKIFFFKTIVTKEVFTIASWASYIPCVIPPVDYFLLSREYKKLFRKVQENVLIDYPTLLIEFEPYFDTFDWKDCKIIHPENAIKAKAKFNTIKPKLKLEDFGERLPIMNLYNAKPE